MILLDTCALVFDALAPERLSAEALRAIEEGEENGSLACCDISLWEIAMLVAKGRLNPGTDALSFLKLVLASRVIRPPNGSYRPQGCPILRCMSASPHRVLFPWRNKQ